MPRIVQILRSEGIKSFPDKGMGIPKYKRQVKWTSQKRNGLTQILKHPVGDPNTLMEIVYTSTDMAKVTSAITVGL